MKAILQYQDVKKSRNSDGLTCTARYLTNIPMSDCTYDDIQTIFGSCFKIETTYIDGATGCWGVEVKAVNCPRPLPLLLSNNEQGREKTG